MAKQLSPLEQARANLQALQSPPDYQQAIDPLGAAIMGFQHSANRAAAQQAVEVAQVEEARALEAEQARRDQFANLFARQASVQGTLRETGQSETFTTMANQLQEAARMSFQSGDFEEGRHLMAESRLQRQQAVATQKQENEMANIEREQVMGLLDSVEDQVSFTRALGAARSMGIDVAEILEATGGQYNEQTQSVLDDIRRSLLSEKEAQDLEHKAELRKIAKQRLDLQAQTERRVAANAATEIALRRAKVQAAPAKAGTKPKTNADIRAEYKLDRDQFYRDFKNFNKPFPSLQMWTEQQGYSAPGTAPAASAATTLPPGWGVTQE